MPDYGYTLSEHDPEKPWLVLNVGHRTVELPGADFRQWARETWPSPRWHVEPDPWQFGPTLWPR